MNNLVIQKQQQSENLDIYKQQEDTDSIQNRLLLNTKSTPSRIESNFQTSINKTFEKQSFQQLNNEKQIQSASQDEDIRLNNLELKKQTLISYHSSKSSKTQIPMKIGLLQASLIAKDQLILNLQEEIRQLKKHQIQKDEQMSEQSRNYEIKLQQMNNKIIDLECIIKQKDHHIEQFNNYNNNTINQQDLSVLTNIQNDPKKQFNQGYNADLYLNNNFWLISAERKLQGSNPIYNYYQLKDNIDVKQTQFDNQQQKGIQIESMKQMKYNSNTNIQLTKLNEISSQINLQQSKYHQNNIRSQSLQQNDDNYKNYSSQPYINKDFISYNSDDFLVDQQINQMLTTQPPIKMETLDWNQQPSNKYMITYNNHLNQSKQDYVDKTQKSYNHIRKQNSHKFFNK